MLRETSKNSASCILSGKFPRTISEKLKHRIKKTKEKTIKKNRMTDNQKSENKILNHISDLCLYLGGLLFIASLYFFFIQKNTDFFNLLLGVSLSMYPISIFIKKLKKPIVTFKIDFYLKIILAVWIIASLLIAVELGFIALACGLMIIYLIVEILKPIIKLKELKNKK